MIKQLRTSASRSRYRAHSSERGAAIAGLLGLAAVVIAVISLVFFTFGRIVPPGFVGIRHNGFGVFGVLDKGYGSQGLQPGLHWRIPGGISDIILLPKGFQFVNFKSEGKDVGGLKLHQLDVPTSDGSKVKTDVTLIVRLFDKPGTAPIASQPDQELSVADVSVPVVTYQDVKHGGPGNLVLAYTDSPDRQLRILARVAEDKLREFLGQLSTEDYYNPSKRELRALEAQASINNTVAPNGMNVWSTLIRRYVYAEQDIDNQIFAKNLQDQQERLNAAERILAEMKAKTERESALWDAKKRTLAVEGDANVQVIVSEGERYKKERMGEADLLVAEAVAEVDRAEANALSQVEGADVYVAKEISEIVSTLKGGVVADLDPYDIDAWVKKLTSRGEG